MAAARNRFRFSFWLDAEKDDELLVAETIDELKRQRSFTSTIRDGIMLMTELRQGKTDLLLRLFPWLADALKPSSESGGDDMKSELAELKRLIQQQVSGGSIGTGNGYLMSATIPPKRPAALPDDDDAPALEVKASDVDVSGNFLAAFSAAFGD